MSSSISTGEYAAHWWLPDYPDLKVGGRYIVRADGVTEIELFENLEEKVATSSGEEATWSPVGPEVHKILHGYAKGMALTAVNARFLSLEDTLGPTRLEKRAPRYVVESNFFCLNEEELRFNRFNIEPVCLNELTSWAEVHHLDHESSVDGSVNFTSMVVTQAEQIVDCDEVRVSLDQRQLLHEDATDDHITISKVGRVAVIASEPLDVWTVLREYFHPIMFLFTFISGQPENAGSILVSSDELPWPDEYLPEGAGETEHWMTIRIPVLRRGTRGARSREPLLLLDFAPWTSSLPMWLNWAKLNRAELQLLLLLIDPSYPWIEAKFLTCAQMLEGIHRKAFPVGQEEIDRNASMVEEVMVKVRDIEGLKADDRSDIRYVMKYLYEPSLERRIRQLDAAAGYIVSSRVPDFRVVARGCATLRNYFDHSTEKRPVDDTRAVRVAHAVMSLICFSFILTRIGLTEESAAAAVRSWSGAHNWLHLVDQYGELLADL